MIDAPRRSRSAGPVFAFLMLLLALPPACTGGAEAPPNSPNPAAALTSPAPDVVSTPDLLSNGAALDSRLPIPRAPESQATPPASGRQGPIGVYRRIQAFARAHKLKGLLHMTTASLSEQHPEALDIRTIDRLFRGAPLSTEIQGGRTVITLDSAEAALYAVLLWSDGRWLYDTKLSLRYRPPAPAPPESPEPTLEDVTADIEGSGRLVARIETSLGTLRCVLHEDAAPRTVANFVGLARGIRPWFDSTKKEWVRTRFYDGLTFHRAIAGFMILAGMPKGGRASGPGFTIPDEIDLNLRYDRPGVLGMANAGPNSAGSQFFITDAPAPWLDNRFTVFGDCAPVRLIAQIAHLDKRPGTMKAVKSCQIRSVLIEREIAPDSRASPQARSTSPASPTHPR